jgi:hypothetical protein
MYVRVKAQDPLTFKDRDYDREMQAIDCEPHPKLHRGLSLREYVRMTGI